MKLSAEQLTEIEGLASLFFMPDEIAIVLGLNPVRLEDELLDQSSPVYQAFQKGKLKSKAELRKSILSLAKQGSGPAQTLAVRLLQDLESRTP